MEDRYSPDGLRHRIPEHPDLFFTSTQFGYEVYRTVGRDLDDISYVDGFKTKRELNKWIAELPTISHLLAAAELKRAGVVNAGLEWLGAQADWSADRNEFDDRLIAAVREHCAAQAALRDQRGHQ